MYIPINLKAHESVLSYDDNTCILLPDNLNYQTYATHICTKFSPLAKSSLASPKHSIISYCFLNVSCINQAVVSFLSSSHVDDKSDGYCFSITRSSMSVEIIKGYDICLTSDIS